MHRETILAIGIGLGLGLLVAVGIYQFRRVATPNTDRPVAAQPLEEEADQKNDNLSSLNLSSPQDGVVVSSPNINLIGTTNSAVTLLLFGPKSETIISKPNQETFDSLVTLQPGANILTLIAIDEKGQTESTERLVVYDSTSNEVENSSLLSPTATPSTSTTKALLERINQKIDPEEPTQPINSAIDQLRLAYLGQVERVTDEAIRLQTKTQALNIALEKLKNVRLGEKKIEPTQIEVENWLLLIGALTESDNIDSFIPEKTVVYTDSPRPQAAFVTLGNLESLTKSQLQLVERQSGNSTVLPLASSVRYLDDEDNLTSATNFTSDTGVLVTGYLDADKKMVTAIRALAPFAKEEMEE